MALRLTLESAHMIVNTFSKCFPFEQTALILVF